MAALPVTTGKWVYVRERMGLLRNNAVRLFPWHQMFYQAPGLTYDRSRKLHTLVTQKRDSRNVARTMPRVKSSRCRCSSWNSSTSPVITDSMPPICGTQRMVVGTTLPGPDFSFSECTLGVV